ncbi:DNA-binding transcriptional ArsR family regulator [Mycobacterium sp. OTB74]|nr:DNA-binding transcriptional ArsR family regulator [Mycobacterium sp. OTB74]
MTLRSMEPNPVGPSALDLQEAASTFGLLAATVRLHILWLLSEGARDVSTLAEETEQSVATVSHHLSKLKLAGLVRDSRHGKRRVYVVTDSKVVDMVRGSLVAHMGQPVVARLAR